MSEGREQMEILQVNIRQAKTHLSELIHAALNGKQFIIAKGNKPAVRLEVLPEGRVKRKIGNAKGLIVTKDDDFDAPVEDFNLYRESGGPPRPPF
jgi:antitoxin (DNA-binding transcriptional repressor) of toxin-antitoxin stability system